MKFGRKSVQTTKFVSLAWKMIGWWKGILPRSLLWSFFLTRRLPGVKTYPKVLGKVVFKWLVWVLTSLLKTRMRRVNHLPPNFQVQHTTWPEKLGSGAAAHGAVIDMLSDLRKDMQDWMQHRKLTKHVTWLWLKLCQCIPVCWAFTSLSCSPIF